MSRHNRVNPTINFSHVDEAIYESQPYQFNDIYSQQWMSAGPRTVIPTAPSPTNTVRTNWTAPTGTVNQIGVQQPRKASQRHGNIDPRLQVPHPYLLPPGPRTSPTAQHIPEPIVNPIARFYHQDDPPWSALGMGMRNPQEVPSRSNFHHTQESYSQYRQGPCSDIGSNVPASDSGYCTQQTRSVLSNEPGHVHQELPPDIMTQARNLNVESENSEFQAMVRIASDQRSMSQYSNRSGHQKQQFPCSEPGCSMVLKCQSEHKKHMLKHVKDFICNIPGCKRGSNGFSTVNDLDRHKKSVHKIGLTNSKSWRCAAGSCTNKTKIWPRLDNFKQHIERMHKEEDKFELIKRSRFYPQEPQTVVQPLSVDPSHLLAGMGSESALAIEGPDDTTFSTNLQSFEYPQFMSISGRSSSNASQVSPSTNSLGIAMSQSGTGSFNRTGGNASTGQDFSQLTGSLPEEQSGCQKSLCVSSAGAIPKPTSTQGSKHNGNTTLPLELSNTAQTKAEQQRQRQALEKLAKANLEDILLRVLGEQSQQDGTNGSPFVVLSETDRLALADLIKQTIKPPRAPQRRLTQGSSSGVQHCPYEDCSFSGRTCDLNKHVKRHKKPYGCTYPKCHKRFGAKSDWKRHENSQHFQQEAFRCNYLHSSGRRCGQHYYRMAQFQKHLELEHKITSQDKVQEYLARCKIGKNRQIQYWCGFCCEIKILKTKRNLAWDERFDHIANHFEKDSPKKCIDDWICVEENKTKKELEEEVLLARKGKDVDAESSNDGDELSLVAEGTAYSFSESTQDTCRKRSAPEDTSDPCPPTKRKKTVTTVIYCCGCGYGGSNALQDSCMDCMHFFCRSCRGETVVSCSLED